MDNKHKIIASYINESALEQVLKLLKRCDVAEDGKIYVLEVKNNPDTLLLTYRSNKDLVLPESFIVHRSKTHTMLYTLNALKYLCVTQYGYFSKELVVDLSTYKHCILTMDQGNLNVKRTHLLQIADLRDY